VLGYVSSVDDTLNYASTQLAEAKDQLAHARDGCRSLDKKVSQQNNAK